jgi:hypothetical protein
MRIGFFFRSFILKQMWKVWKMWIKKTAINNKQPGKCGFLKEKHEYR